MEDSNKIKTPEVGFIKHVFDFGDESKSKMMNSIHIIVEILF